MPMVTLTLLVVESNNAFSGDHVSKPILKVVSRRWHLLWHSPNYHFREGILGKNNPAADK